MSIAFAYYTITGFTNAFRFNGIASVAPLIFLVAITYVAILAGDPVIVSLAFVMMGSSAEFLF
jgi:hypothetical protein